MNEKYTRKELRSIYKDAKYNWSKNPEPMDLADNVDKIIYIAKIDGDIILYLKDGDQIEYDEVIIHSFNEFIKFYEALVNLIK